MQSDGNLNQDEEPRQETGNEMKEEKLETNEVKTYENEGEGATDGTAATAGSSMTKIIIVVAAAIVVIVVVVVVYGVNILVDLVLVW